MRSTSVSKFLFSYIPFKEEESFGCEKISDVSLGKVSSNICYRFVCRILGQLGKLQVLPLEVIPDPEVWGNVVCVVCW